MGSIKHCEKKLPLKYAVFEKEIILATKIFEFDFETSELDFEVPKSSIRKHATLCDKDVLSSIIISQLQRPNDFKFSQVCYFMQMLKYTK